jgi:fatty acid desaturase
MEKTFAKAEELAENVKDYFDTRLDAAKLKVAEKTSLVASTAAAGFVVLLVLVFFGIFLAIGFALLIGEWIGKPWAGFMIVAVLCLIKAAVIWFARKRFIQLPIMNALIQQLFTNDENDEED